MLISGAFIVFYSVMSLINLTFQVIDWFTYHLIALLLTALSANSSLRQLGSGCRPYRLGAIKEEK